MMLWFIEKKSDCTGCGACQNICPHGAIQMLPDEEGFLYPCASEKCIQCGLCKQICPLRAPPDLERKLGLFRSPPFAIRALTNDLSVWFKSSSGGAFHEICTRFPDEACFVGAEMKYPDVEHSMVDFRSLDRILKSKYIQSIIGLTYRRVKDVLLSGKNVVFVGTPCQVAGLLCYLGNRPEKLLCIEFICHGNGSPLVFRRFLKEHEQRESQGVVNYFFREKSLSIEGGASGYVSKFTYAAGGSTCVLMDDYNQLFLSQLCIRPCCGARCPYRNPLRNSDLTLADLKGELMAGHDGVRRNASVIVANTKKGREIVDQLSSTMQVQPYALSQLVRVNPLFDHTTPANPFRDEFFHRFSGGVSVRRLVKVYVARPKLFAMLRLTPYKVVRLARRLLQRRTSTCS